VFYILCIRETNPIPGISVWCRVGSPSGRKPAHTHDTRMVNVLCSAQAHRYTCVRVCVLAGIIHFIYTSGSGLAYLYMCVCVCVLYDILSRLVSKGRSNYTYILLCEYNAHNISSYWHPYIYIYALALYIVYEINLCFLFPRKRCCVHVFSAMLFTLYR
jgi:hypothetical protein